MSKLEDRLSSVLADAADRAPRASAGLAATVETRHRRRRARTTALLAAAAVVVVIGGAGVAVNAVRTSAAPQPAVGATDKATNRAEPPVDVIPPPIEKVWPQAAQDPGQTARRPRLQPATAFGRSHTAGSDAGHGRETPVPVALRPGQRPTHPDRRDPPTKGLTIGAYGVAAGGGNIVWWTLSKEKVAWIWTVPVRGGTPRPVTDVPLGNVMKQGHLNGLTVAGQDVIFAYEKGVSTGCR